MSKRLAICAAIVVITVNIIQAEVLFSNKESEASLSDYKFVMTVGQLKVFLSDKREPETLGIVEPHAVSLIAQVEGNNYEIFENHNNKGYYLGENPNKSIRIFPILGGYIVQISLQDTYWHNTRGTYQLFKFIQVGNGVRIGTLGASPAISDDQGGFDEAKLISQSSSVQYLVMRFWTGDQSHYMAFRIFSTKDSIEISDELITKVSDKKVRLRKNDSTGSPIISVIDSPALVSVNSYGKRENIGGGTDYYYWTRVTVIESGDVGWIYGQFLESKPGIK